MCVCVCVCVRVGGLEAISFPPKRVDLKLHVHGCTNISMKDRQ